LTYTYLTRTISGLTAGQIQTSDIGNAISFTVGAAQYIGVIESIAATSIVLAASASLPSTDGTVDEISLEEIVAHFTSKEKLKAFLNADQVTALFSKIPAEEQDTPFAYADSKITSSISEEPAEDGDNYEILESIAGRIIIWNLSGQQQWNDTNKPELDRREKLYKDALIELDAIANGDIDLEPSTEEATGSEFDADCRRTENW
jgi:hypothetical protein